MNWLPAVAKQALHRIYKKAEIRDHQLLYLFLEITRLCNLSCRHCGSDCGAQSKFASLTTDSWLRILENVAESFTPAPTLVLTGGEPLMHPELPRILEKIHALRLRWGMVSNGYRLDERALDMLLRFGLYSITVSLDGCEANHNYLRGKPDAYARTVRALKLLGRAEIPCRDVVTCVHGGNLADLDAVAELLLELGIPAWRLFRIFPAGRAQNDPSLQMSLGQTRQMLDWIAEKKPIYAKRGLDVNLSCEGWLPMAADLKVRKQPFFCRAGVNVASVLCDGTLTGCSNNSAQFYQGNILRDSLAFQWENEFRIFRDRAWVKDSTCGSCEHVGNCQGGSVHLWREHLRSPEFCYKDCPSNS